jgi:hypothetical protein
MKIRTLSITFLTVTFLPVVQTDEEETLARQQDEIKNYLKPIHQTMKAKT